LATKVNQPMLEIKNIPEEWGRFVESAIGAHLANGIQGHNIELYYWAGYNTELDFILVQGDQLIALEVKSGKIKNNLPGMTRFCKEFKVSKKLLVGQKGIPIETFLSTKPNTWFN